MGAAMPPDGSGRRDPAALQRVPFWRSVRARVVLSGAVLNALLVLVVVAASFYIAQRIIWNTAQSRLRQQAELQAERIGATLRSVEISLAIVNRLAQEHSAHPDYLVDLVHAAVDADPDASAGTVALEPGVAARGEFAYYVDGHRGHDLVAEGEHYREQDWYRRTRDGARAWWTDPYPSPRAGGEWVVTCNQPLRAGDGRRLGMVSLSIPVKHLAEQMRTVIGRKRLRSVLIAPGGTLVVHPDPGVALHKRVRDLIDSGRSDLVPLEAARLSEQGLGYVHRDPITREQRFTVIAPVQATGWSLTLGLSDEALLADLKRATRWLLAGALLALLVFALAQLRLAQRLAGPLEQVTASMRHFSRGDYDQPVPHVQRRDEIGVMARAMEGARTSIKRQLDEIEQMGAARQKLESELDIARDIQLAMLPVAPTLRHRGRTLRVYATLEPAKTVGGDFYSFAVRRKRWLWFAIGDVSDKGVPAALFMARAMTVLEVAAGLGGSPGDALATAAGRLAENNDTCMFATVLCGVLDVKTGELQLASAGHEPAVLVRANGSVELLELEAGAALGVDAGETYPVWRGQVQAGDTLVAYTDGVTEAFNAAGQAFGLQGLVESLVPGGDPQRTCLALLYAMHRFCKGAPQSDDITVLAMCLDTQPEDY